MMIGETQRVAHQLEDLLKAGAADEALQVVSSLHPADQAEVFSKLSEGQREAFIALLSAEQAAHLLEHLDDDDLRDVVSQMPRASLARVLDKVDNDIAAYILRTLPPSESARVLSIMAEATDVAPILEHAESTAGGLMTRGFVALHPDMTVAEAINYLRLVKPDVEEAYYLYVMDRFNHLIGVLSLRHLIIAPANTRLSDIMNRQVIAVPADADQEEAARLISHYRLRALPVLDDDGRLLGVITVDDLMEVAEEEATEDMYRMVGLSEMETIYMPLARSVGRRLPWLMVNLVTAFIAALTVSTFEPTIAKIAALAIFMPMVAGQGGNAGIQTLTLVVRSIALGEVELRDTWQVIIKQIGVSAVNAMVIGFIVAMVAWMWQGNPTLGLIVGLAMFMNMVVAGLFGALVPIGMRWLRLDPALASGIFVTMMTDVMGFFFLLGLATVLIDRLT